MTSAPSAAGDGVGEKGSKSSLNPFDDDDDDDTKNPFDESDDGKKPHPEPRSPQKGDARHEASADRKVSFAMMYATKPLLSWHWCANRRIIFFMIEQGWTIV